MKAKKCTKKRDARAKLLFCQSKPIGVFRPFSLPSPSSLLKLPINQGRHCLLYILLLLTRDMYLEGKNAVSWPGLQELLFPSETDMRLVRHQRYKLPEMKQQSVWYLATNYHCLYYTRVEWNLRVSGRPSWLRKLLTHSFYIHIQNGGEKNLEHCGKTLPSNCYVGLCPW